MAVKTKTKIGPHLIVDAKAGTGKTTTLVEGLVGIQKGARGHKPEFKPSDQQRDIWRLMRKGKQPLSMMMCAFNKSIAEELKNKVPLGCEAATLHSIGYRAVSNYFGKGRLKMNDKWKTSNLLEEIMEMDIQTLRKKHYDKIKAVEHLVGLCKLKLIGVEWNEFESVWLNEVAVKKEIPDLALFHDVQLNGDEEEIGDLVYQVLNEGADLDRENFEIDYPDMLWLPVINELRIVKRDLLLVDEAQDLSPVQQELAMMCGKRLVLCGDPHQAIYGFAGADCASMENMNERLMETEGGVKTLPLNTTYRCAKAIVRMAKKIVPEYEAYEKNEEGFVKNVSGNEDTKGNFMELLGEGDMVLCRVNAPLVSTCFRLLSRGTKATIIGRDIGQGLIRMIKKLKAVTVSDLMDKVEEHSRQEIEKIMKRKNPNSDLVVMLNDKAACVVALCEECYSVDDVLKKIEQMFQDKEQGGVRLSSIHRSKGLEAERVFILREDLLPHPMAKTKEARKQEMNLKYVAITRAINELYFVDNDGNLERSVS